MGVFFLVMKLILEIPSTNINLLTSRGTALHIASFSSNFHAVKLLLKYKANKELSYKLTFKKIIIKSRKCRWIKTNRSC